jgi:hypothetical protein
MTRISINSPLSELGGERDAFCWQHKDQATPVSPAQRPQSQSPPIKNRTSVDTLVDRLGLLELEEERKKAKRKPGRKYDEKMEWHGTTRSANPRPEASSYGFFCCCFGFGEEPIPPKRSQIPSQKASQKPNTTPSRPNIQPMQYAPQTQNAGRTQSRPSLSRNTISQTSALLSLIPPTTSPQIASSLLAELAKPVSEVDGEGYIYIFWLTSESLPATPPSEAAPSLLEIPSRRNGGLRTSDIMQTFSTSSRDPKSAKSKTILLKIGRASNVQRRLNEWSRQCGYNLSLIRYYPYQTSSASNTPPVVPRKVPNAHKVERLIHIELGQKRATGSGKCDSCGREHKEWFEVEASRRSVKDVDEVVRRWVDWGMRSTR